MKFHEPIEFKEIIRIAKGHLDLGISYCVYSEVSDSDKLRLNTTCYIAEYPEITDDDNEVFNEFVVSHALNLIFREELLQDVISNVVNQKAFATDQEVLNAITYYSKNDSFMILST